MDKTTDKVVEFTLRLIIIRVMNTNRRWPLRAIFCIYILIDWLVLSQHQLF